MCDTVYVERERERERERKTIMSDKINNRQVKAYHSMSPYVTCIPHGRNLRET